MPFSNDAWAANTGANDAILSMPFNNELAVGTLPRETFQGYIVQDAHYLLGFSRALSLAAAKAPTADRLIQFSDAAKEAIVVERALHGSYFAQWGLDAATVDAMPVTAATHHYVSFLMATAYGEPYEVVLAALLPCFWIYLEVGKDLATRTAPDNPYKAWIDEYAGEEFETAVKAAIAATDEAAETASPQVRNAMHAAYTAATRLEWIFWDSAYRRDTWPV
ncbi:MAG: thiaminase II [Acuticoccus sp.]